MSPRHFARAFKAETGESPARFVAASRLEAARLLLTDSVLPLKSVADRCGFASADVLGRRFRDRSRVTPAIYRERFGA
jgi:transcriptional regulator GlxA family with amidase domain